MFSTLKLGSKTVLGKEEYKKVKTILQSLLDNGDSYEFRNPVDWKGNVIFFIGSFEPYRLSILDQKPYGFRYN